MAFGSGFRDLLSNLQTTSAARSCFADLSASWIYLGLVSCVSTRIFSVVPTQLFSRHSLLDFAACFRVCNEQLRRGVLAGLGTSWLYPRFLPRCPPLRGRTCLPCIPKLTVSLHDSVALGQKWLRIRIFQIQTFRKRHA